MSESTVTYRVRASWTVVADDFPTLRAAQSWLDKHEGRGQYRGGPAMIAESAYPLTSGQTLA